MAENSKAAPYADAFEVLAREAETIGAGRPAEAVLMAARGIWHLARPDGTSPLRGRGLTEGDCLHLARYALDAALASTARAGAGDWVTVPRALTDAMYEAFEAEYPLSRTMPYDRADDLWKAFLSAVPASPRSGAGDGEDHSPFEEIAAQIMEREDASPEMAFLRRTVAGMKASPPAPAEHGAEIRERIAAAIRKALVENWSDAVNARDWDEDVLLTGCRRVGGGKGYEKPEEAARNLALDAADAVLSALSQGGQAGGSEKGAGEWADFSAAEITRRTRCTADETRDAVVWRDCCDLILERLGALTPDPAQSPSTSNGEG